MSAPSGANAPYKIKKRGEKWAVVNNTGETKATFDSRDKALAYQRALYVNVKGAAKRAAKTKFSGKARNRVKADHNDGMSVSENPNAADPISLERGRERALARKYGGPTGFIPHKAEGSGRCALCSQPEKAAEHLAYEAAYADTMPKHPFVASRPAHSPADGRFGFGAPRSKECVVCGQPNSHPLHDDQPTVITDAPKKAISLDPVLNQPGPQKQLAEYTGSGCMVALYPNGEALAGIKTAGSLPLEDKADMHVTLVYMKTTPTGEELDLLKSVVEDMATTEGPLTGVWGGTARFNPSEGSDGKPVLVALPDLPDLADFREDLVDALQAAGFEPASDHGYTPHLTVAYDDNGQVRAEGALSFGMLTLKTKDDRFDYPLTGAVDMDAEAASEDDEHDMGKIAQGIDAAVDDALTHLRSCADLPPYALQAQAVLQGIEPACDALLDYFGVSDADDDPETDSEKSREQAKAKKGKHHFVGAAHLHPSVVHSAGYFGGCYACGHGQEDEAHEGSVEDEGPSSGGGAAGGGAGGATTAAESAAMVSANKDAEASQIALNKATDRAKSAHAFIPSLYQSPTKCLMCGQGEPDSGNVCNSDPVNGSHIPVMAQLTQVRDRVFAEAEAKPLPVERAFITEVSGRTILTGPAETLPGIEKAMTPNQHFLWMQGRFVGAEKANRNGAFWSTKDLELGEPTVRYGPLNWLHEAKHIIGTLADQRLVHPTQEQAAEGQSPHIFTLSPIWKWIYPDEAYVVEAASDSGKLWYSMECVSKDVVCVGDNGCGTSVPYMEYLQARPGTTKACQHLRERSSTRQFSEPTFLGGAVIVPPVRPGWGEADATILRQAAAYAEDSFEQAGRPQMSATEWEHVMADVLQFASL